MTLSVYIKDNINVERLIGEERQRDSCRASGICLLLYSVCTFHFSNDTNANYHLLLVEYIRAIIKTFWIPLCKPNLFIRSCSLDLQNVYSDLTQ